jgi:hypothetical protein
MLELLDYVNSGFLFDSLKPLLSAYDHLPIYRSQRKDQV